MCFETIPCKTFYSWKTGVWNGSHMMWDSFQTSAIVAKNLSFLCFWKPSCIRRNVLAYACFGPAYTSRNPRMQVEGHFDHFISKNKFFAHLKGYIFHFSTPQVNLIFDWALNWSWALKFEYHWGTGAWVVRVTKYGVYNRDFREEARWIGLSVKRYRENPEILNSSKRCQAAIELQLRVQKRCVSRRKIARNECNQDRQ